MRKIEKKLHLVQRKEGIPKSAIILFFRPAYAREASGFAVA